MPNPGSGQESPPQAAIELKVYGIEVRPVGMGAFVRLTTCSQEQLFGAPDQPTLALTVGPTKLHHQPEAPQDSSPQRGYPVGVYDTFHSVRFGERKSFKTNH